MKNIIFQDDGICSAGLTVLLYNGSRLGTYKSQMSDRFILKLCEHVTKNL